MLLSRSELIQWNNRLGTSLTCISSYFAHFEGHQECGITSRDLYTPPQSINSKHPKHSHFCHNRANLLEAMSSGGRHGFDTPYAPLGCHYRWYTAPEICMILERFDAIVFIGDEMLKTIYSAFNMLLRENIAMGGLRQWEMDDAQREGCRCDNQIVKPDCSKHMIMNSEEVRMGDEGSAHRSPYYCDRIPILRFPEHRYQLTNCSQEHHTCFSPSQARQHQKNCARSSTKSSAPTQTPTNPYR